jgi:monofunctional biosynthetic peptidoglycan transglycosylase
VAAGAAQGNFWRLVVRGALGTAAICFAIVTYGWLTLPDVRGLRTEAPPTTAFMRLRHAEAVAAGKPPVFSQRYLRYSRISPSLVRAVLVAEDAAFFAHDGIDYEELRASMGGSLKFWQWRGASTITQQLAKNLYLSPSRNPYRKVIDGSSPAGWRLNSRRLAFWSCT